MRRARCLALLPLAAVGAATAQLPTRHHTVSSTRRQQRRVCTYILASSLQAAVGRANRHAGPGLRRQAHCEGRAPCLRPVQRGHTARLPRRPAAPASLKMAASCASQLALVPAVRRANPRCAAACAAAPAACKPQCRAQRRAGCLRLRSWHTSHLDRKAVGRLARALTNRSPRCRSAARASLAGVARPCGVRALRCVALPVVVRRSDRPLLALERVLQRVDRASRRTRAPP